MEIPFESPSATPDLAFPRLGGVHPHVHGHGVTWSAVIGGAIVVASVSLILLALGAGLGLSTVSPWTWSGHSATVIGGATIAWLVAMQVMSGGLGGYLAGRFRNRWSGIHGDEVYFRDTAHGFLAWGLAFLMTAAVLTAATTVLAGGAAASPGQMTSEETADPSAYYVDRLFRSDRAIPDSTSAAVRSEASRIFARALAASDITSDDRSYLTHLISARTGLADAEAGTRLTSVLADARQAAADVAAATGHSLLWIFLGLLVGAFSASYAATIGGRQRDRVLPG